MLGEHVRNMRKKRGITLKELAEKTGLSIGYISKSSAISPTRPCPPCANSAPLWTSPPICLWEVRAAPA